MGAVKCLEGGQFDMLFLKTQLSEAIYDLKTFNKKAKSGLVFSQQIGLIRWNNKAKTLAIMSCCYTSLPGTKRVGY